MESVNGKRDKYIYSTVHALAFRISDAYHSNIA
jgi:hypothetical protein